MKKEYRYLDTQNASKMFMEVIENKGGDGLVLCSRNYSSGRYFNGALICNHQ